MHTLNAMIRLYPYWALPLALAAFEIGRQMTRMKKPKKVIALSYATGVLLLGLVIVWFATSGSQFRLR